MAAPATRKKTFHYKRAYLVGASSGQPTLSKYLESALSKHPTAMARAETLGDSDETVRVISGTYKLGTLLCGRFLDYAKDGHQAVVGIDPAVDELPIRYLPPNADEQYFQGVVTFGVRGNHVVLVHSKGLRSAHFEHHLNWLLTKHAAVLPDGVIVALEDEPNQEVRQKLSDVDYIELRAPITLTELLTPGEAPTGALGVIREYIRELRPTKDSALERLDAAAALASPPVELSIRVKRKGRRRDGPSLADEIAHTLRNSNDSEFTIKTRSGTYSSDQLKLTTQETVPVEPNGMPSLKAAAYAMQAWLAELVEQRRVGP